MKLRNLSIDQGEWYVVRRVACYSSAISDELWFLTTGPTVRIPVIFQEFSSGRTAGVSSRSITVTNKSNSLTYTVASSFVSTSLLAVITVVGLLETLTVSKSAELRSFLINSMHARAGVHHKFSFLRFYCGCGWQNPLIGWRTECSFSYSLS